MFLVCIMLGMVIVIVMVQVECYCIQEIVEVFVVVFSVCEVYLVIGEWDIVVIVKFVEYDCFDDVVIGYFCKIDGIMWIQIMFVFCIYNEEVLDQGFGIGLDG